MLMYLILPFVVWLFDTKKLYGLYFAVSVVCTALIFRIAQSFYYDLSANHSYKMPHQPGYNEVPDGFSLYIVGEGLSFASCYFSGVALAFFMVIIDEKNAKFVLQRWIYFVLVALSGFILLSLVMWPYEDVKDAPESRWSVADNSWYKAFDKTAWVKWAFYIHSLSDCLLFW